MITISTVKVVEVLDSTFEIGITILNDDTRTWGKIISMRPNFDDVNDDSNNDDDDGYQWSGIDPLTWTSELLLYTLDVSISLVTICSVSTSLATLPSLSTPRLKYLVWLGWWWWRQLMMGYESDCIDGDVSTLYQQSIVTFSQ